MMSSSLTGRVTATRGITLQVADFPAPVGAICEIHCATSRPKTGQVIGLRGNHALIYPFGEWAGIRLGAVVRLQQACPSLPVGPALLGRVINARGQRMDGGLQPPLYDRVMLHGQPPEATRRPVIDSPLNTGLRAVDALLTCGHGQRLGVFSEAGVGKSETLGMLARHSEADINVIALIGERGREVNEFIQRDLSPRGLARSVVVVSTSDQPALLRVQAAFTATAVAEYFRDRGKRVLLLVDSLTRFAAAQRDIGMAAGELPDSRGGYPPSVFAMLSKLVQRAGGHTQGSITAFYSVLMDGEAMNEPFSDALRGMLDGHLVLTRHLASQGLYPAIDVVQSVSRSMKCIVDRKHWEAAARVRRLLAAYEDSRNPRSVGTFQPGSRNDVDAAVRMQDPIRRFLAQSSNEHCSLPEARRQLLQLAGQSKEAA